MLGTMAARRARAAHRLSPRQARVRRRQQRAAERRRWRREWEI